MSANILPQPQHLLSELTSHERRIISIDQRLDRVEQTLIEHTQTLAEHTQTLAEHTQTLAEHTQTLAEHSRILAEHTDDLQIIKATLFEHSIRFDVLERNLEKMSERMEAGFAWIIDRLS